MIEAGRVAVVTGAASGIGFGLSERLASEGMKVVMADVEEPALAEASELLLGRGAEVLPVVTDVCRADQVEAMRGRALAAFGAVHLVCNNAGIVGDIGRPVWEMTQPEWEWILGVNLWGVINGVRAFVPTLLDQEEGHMVNTASAAGLTTGLGAYSVTKHGVVALSEGLHLQLQLRGAHVGVSVLCPGWVKTRIMESDRNRPAELGPAQEPDPAEELARQALGSLVETGTSPADVAAHVVGAVEAGRFYVLTHPDFSQAIQRRTEEVLAGGPPSGPVL